MAVQGFWYMADVLTAAEERQLLANLAEEPYAPIAMRGQTTRREIVSYGRAFAPYVGTLPPAPPIPTYLHGVRRKLARLVGIAPGPLVQSLITRYPQGASIGWHRDHSDFGDTVLVLSLAGTAILDLRSGDTVSRTRVEPRSLYVLAGAARTSYEHRVVARALRYSVTFRSLAGRVNEPVVPRRGTQR